MVEKCEECSGSITRDSLGNAVCINCGLIQSQEAVYCPPPFLKKQRLGSLMSRKIHSMVDRSNPDGEAVAHSKYFRLCKLQEMVYSGATFDPFKMHKDLDSISEYLMLPSEVTAKTIECFEGAIARARNPYNNYGLLMAICLVVVCRNLGEAAPIRLTEVVEAFERRNYHISLRVLVKNLSYAANIMPVHTKFRQPEDFVGKVVERLREISYVRVRVSLAHQSQALYFEDLERTAKDLISSVPPNKRSGKNPFLIAASAVFAASSLIAARSNTEDIFTKAQYSKDIGIAEFTLRNHLSSIFNIKPAVRAFPEPPVLCQKTDAKVGMAAYAAPS